MAWIGLFLILAMALAMGGGDSDPGEPEGPTEGNDSLTGTDGDDLIDGLGGDDTIRGMEGDDTLIGGDGDDWLRGGEGDDSLLGGDGNDRLDQGGGINTLDGGPGDDTLTLSDGFETRRVFDEDGRLVSMERSHLDGGDGDETEGDLLDASDMTEALHLYDDGDIAFIATSPRFDSSVTIAGFERYAFGSGHDVVEYYREDQALLIDTGAGQDALYLGNGAHRISAGADDDIIAIGTAGAFDTDIVIDGGEGIDRLELTGGGVLSLVVDDSGSGVATDAVGGGNVAFESIERFRLSDTSLVDASATGFGVEVMVSGGESTLLGGSGNDTLSGETVYGGAGDDVLEGGYVEGGEGDDLITGIILDGGEGNDTLQGNVMTGGAGTDHFIAYMGVGDGVWPEYEPKVITDFESGETIAATVSYNTVDSNDPSITYPEPVVTIEEDAEANEVRLLVDGQPVLVVQGVSTLPEGALDLTVSGTNPWTL